MQTVLRVSGLLVASLLLTACAKTQVRPPPQAQEALPAIGAPDLREATVYEVSAASRASIHVFKGGTLARLGHNHVMTAHDITGRVWMHASFERSGFELSFPVAALVVDDPQARATAGAEFPGEISEDDREGTRKNMLLAAVLDAQSYPMITLRSVRIEGSQANAHLIVRITIKGVSRDVAVPVTVTIDGNRLRAAGEFDVQQTDFGIKPFSIGLGALEVQDRLHVVFNIIADK